MQFHYTLRRISDAMLGEHFEREIREQPDVWAAIAASDKAQRLADAIDGRDIVLLGSGSSLFIAQLGALALRRRAIRAHALAATEVPLDHAAYAGSATIAVSQSGESEDLLHALDVLNPGLLIALTNSPQSPLAERASLAIDVGAGREIAVPASKSVTATAAILLWAAGMLGQAHQRSAKTLIETADDVRSWLDSSGVEEVRDAARRIASRRSVLIFGTGYGLPIAHEFALKLKEASYIHAEGFSAGEFRHGRQLALRDRRQTRRRARSRTGRRHRVQHARVAGCSADARALHGPRAPRRERRAARPSQSSRYLVVTARHRRSPSPSLRSGAVRGCRASSFGLCCHT